MRYPEGHKETVRAQIVEAAARMLRREGLGGVSVARLMREVGLTHGTFYAHFESRDALVAEAIRAAGHQTQAEVFERAPSLDALLGAYLAPEHVAHPDHGCVIAALGTQAAGQPQEVLDAFEYAARGLIGLVQTQLDPTASAPSDEALATTARMVGGVVLARLVHDPALRDRLLDATRQPPPAPAHTPPEG